MYCFSLELMTEPTKTRCGHSFCKVCIGSILRKKSASCPLCKKSLNRRNISKDDHLQTCIEKFKKLVTAAEMDSHIDSEYISKISAFLDWPSFNYVQINVIKSIWGFLAGLPSINHNRSIRIKKTLRDRI